MDKLSDQAKQPLPSEGKRRLHLGGKEVKPGWEILNAVEGVGVDHVGDVRDLSRFADESFDQVYGSHVLEHVSYNRELPRVVEGVHRILRAGGIFCVSVPDLDVLCKLFLHEELSPDDRFQVMRMMFGGQTDPYDFHQVGFNVEFLGFFLAQGGFRQVHRVTEFGLFDDSSALRYKGVPISLNVVALK